MKLPKISIIETVLFLYVLSVVIFSYQENFYLSNYIAMLLVLVYFCDKLNNQYSGINLCHVFFFLFVIICTISVLFNPSSYQRLKTLVQVFVLTLIVSDIIVEKKNLSSVKYAIILGALYANFAALRELSDFVSPNRPVRIGSFLGNPNLFSMILVVGILYALHNIISEKGKPSKLIITLNYFVIVTFGISIVYFTGSRKGIVFLTFFLLFLLAYYFKQARLFHKLLILGSTPFLFLLLFNLLSRSPHFRRIENLYFFLQGGAVTEGSIETRRAMLSRAAELWQQKPFLGWGIDQYRAVSGFGTYSHNNFSEIIVNNGILGLIIYYSIFVVIVFSSIKMTFEKNGNLKYWLLITSSIIFINDFGMVTYYSKVNWILLGSLFGVLQLGINREKEMAT
jgi:O-antigen ligase